MQEAFTRAWRALPGFAGERRFYPWLSVIAANVCTDTLRRRSRVSPVDEVPVRAADLSVDEADEHLIHQVDAAMAVAALARLTPRHQRVLQLREGSGWTSQQIADHEGVAVPAVETLLWRARQALKREFAALAETGGRLGVALGLVGAVIRRAAWRAYARTAAHLPLLSSVRSPGVALASLAVLGASVAGTTAILTGGGSSHPPAATSPARSGAGPAGTTAGSSRASGTSPGPVPAGASPAGGAADPATGETEGGGAVSSPARGAVGDGVGGLTGAAGGEAHALGGTVGDTADGLGGAVGDTADGLGGAVGDTADGLGGAVGDTADGLGGAVGGAGSALGGPAAGAADGAGAAVDGVGGVAGTAVDGVGGVAGTAVDGVGGVAGAAVDGVAGTGDDPVSGTVPTVTVPTLPSL